MSTPNPNPASGGSAQPNADRDLKAAIAAQKKAEDATKDAVKAKEKAETDASKANEKLEAVQSELAGAKIALSAFKDSSSSTSQALSDDDGERREFKLTTNIRRNGKTIAENTTLKLTRTEHGELFQANAISAHWKD